MLDDATGCESFTIISIDSSLVCESKHYLQIYSDKCDYKIVNTQMIDYLHNNLLSLMKISLINNILQQDWFN